MTDNQIEHMVRRFLQWKLPEHFSPDCGISFDPIYNPQDPPTRYKPVGTNLFTYPQAEAMVRHMLEELPQP